MIRTAAGSQSRRPNRLLNGVESVLRTGGAEAAAGSQSEGHALQFHSAKQLGVRGDDDG